MKAELIHHEKKYFPGSSFYEIKIWRVSESKDKPHGIKYSFTYIVNNKRMSGYDNAEGKGDHRHYRDKEEAYEFQGLEKLWKDFMEEIKHLREEKL